jgi:PKD repeat protein
MKRLITTLFSLLAIAAVAQFPSITATVSGHVTLSGTNQPVPGHIIQIMMSTNDSTGTVLYSEVYTNESGEYQFTGTIEGLNGVLEVSTVICTGEVQSQIFEISANAPNVFVADFYICEMSNCMAEFTYYDIDALTYQFINQSIAGEGINYFWSFGDGTFSSEENPLKTYADHGLYEIILTISNLDSTCYSNALQYLNTGADMCKAYFSWYSDSTAGLTVNFQDQSVGNATEWQWDFGDGHYSNEQNPVHTYAEAGFYNVCFTISSADSSCYSYNCELVTVGNNTGCIAQFTYHPSSPEDPNAIQFIDLSYGNLTSWNWSFGDGTGSTEQNPVHYYPTAGVYTACLTIGGPDCQSTWCEEVIVNDSISMCANYFTYVTSGTSVQFTGVQLNNISTEFMWEFGDGVTATGNPVTYDYQVPGIYYVTLMTIDQTGCVAYSAQEVVVGDTMTFNQVYGQVFEDNFPLTNGFVMIFSVESNSNYYPYFDMTMVDSSGVYVFPTVPNGNYNILAVPADGSTYLPTYYESTLFWQEATTVNAAQSVNPLNIQLQNSQGNTTAGPGNITGQINQNTLRSGFIGQIIVYLTDSDHNILQFTQVSSNGEFSFSNLAYGTYYIKPELAGVYSEYQQVILTSETSQVDLTLTFTGNSILGDSEKTAALTDVSIYPNPASVTTRVTWTLVKGKSVSISVCDLSGRHLISQTHSLNSGQSGVDVQVGELQPGIYLIRIKFDNGFEVTKKIVKK